MNIATLADIACEKPGGTAQWSAHGSAPSAVKRANGSSSVPRTASVAKLTPSQSTRSSPVEASYAMNVSASPSVSPPMLRK